jgi:DNA helicase-2/ATP-dependent DNA helicase PcrA
MITSAYTQAYNRLNSEQKQAVDTIFGPVMVVAGPGTGKTQILALRIAKILLESTGTKPDEIVAITFTDSAVTTLRKRLVSLIGVSAYRVRMHTFHSFAKTILDKQPEHFHRIVSGTLLQDAAKAQLLEEVFDECSLELLATPANPYRALKEVVGYISKMKREYYTPQKFAVELMKQQQAYDADTEHFHTKGKYKGKEKGESVKMRKKLLKHREFLTVYERYEQKCLEQNKYDFDDIILEAVRALEGSEDLRLTVGEECQFVLADEHQDANTLQNRLLELVSDFDGSPNLFIVGDEKQAIYSFQGASLASFFYFKERYPDAVIITLTQNYRSTKNIVTLAHEVIKDAPIPDPALRKELVSVIGDGVSVKSIEAPSSEKEVEAIASYIISKVEEGASYEDLAVITRKNADVLALGSSLSLYGIPVNYETVDINALAHPSARLFISLVRATLTPYDDSVVAKALFAPGFPAPEHRVQLLALRDRSQKIIDLMREHSSKEVSSYAQMILTMHTHSASMPALAFLSELAKESGYLKAVLSMPGAQDAYESYQALMEEVKELIPSNPAATAIDVSRFVDLVEKHELRIKRAKYKSAGVTILTSHKAKGQEWPFVLVARALDSVWHKGKSDELTLFVEKGDSDEDARRLFYVAVTRAQKELVIVRPLADKEGKELLALRYMAEASAVEEHTPLSRVQYTTDKEPPLLNGGLIKEILLERGFSPTSFNNYESSPWEFYFKNILRIPEPQTVSLIYGDCVHKALEMYGRNKENEDAFNIALQVFEKELNKKALSHKEREALLEKGTDTLTQYCTQEQFELSEKFEYDVSVFLSVEGVGDIPLHGKLDRIDKGASGAVIIDYKTGKAKSENEIRGTTASSDGNYYRQLVFYKLLLQKEGSYNFEKGVFHFVEREDDEEMVERVFDIPQKDVDDLEQSIIQAVQDVVSLRAFEKKCDPKECSYCDLLF